MFGRGLLFRFFAKQTFSRMKSVFLATAFEEDCNRSFSFGTGDRGFARRQPEYSRERISQSE